MSAKVLSAEQSTSQARRGFGCWFLPAEDSPAWSWALAGLLVLCLVIGLAIGNDFGASTDEYFEARIGRQSIREYLGIGAEYDDPGVLADHGPVYFIPWSLIGDGIGLTLPGWTRPDGRHFFNYLGFLVGVWCFYLVAQRVVRRRAAWMASLLFVTQPLLFGYAFINQKDIPFMVFFLATVACGFAAVERQENIAAGRDHRTPESARRTSETWWNGVVADWLGLPAGGKLALTILLLLCLSLLSDLFIIGSLQDQSGALLRAAYERRASLPVQQIFFAVAQDAFKTPLGLYQEKLVAGFSLARLMAVPVVAIVIGGFACWTLPSMRRGLRALFRGPLPLWILSGVLLGCTVTIRQVGVLAGGLVSVYMLGTMKRRSLLPFIMLWGVAAATTYATWPYLWPDPIQRFLGSLASASSRGGKIVLFNGEPLRSDRLPWNYFPTLASLELTEPAVLLILFGLPVLVWRLGKGRTGWPAALVMALWLGVPLVGVYLFDLTVYDNLRLFLFVLPVLFLLSGMSIEQILANLKPPWARIGILTLILLPGVLGLASLHPYQYAYFNSFVGGVSGAQGRYDPEHWCTSYREAMQVVNEVAQEEAKVLALGQPWSAEMFAREDLSVMVRSSSLPKADYIVVCAWYMRQDWGPQGFQKIYEVRRGEAVFAEVWRRIGSGEAEAES